MTEIAVLDRAFQVIMRRLVETGRAPHYTELAKALGTTMAEGREILHALIDRFVPSWLFPETDHITSFPVPNHRRRRAEVVRPVRVRGAVHDVGLPRRSRARGRTVP